MVTYGTYGSKTPLSNPFTQSVSQSTAPTIVFASSAIESPTRPSTGQVTTTVTPTQPVVRTTQPISSPSVTPKTSTKPAPKIQPKTTVPKTTVPKTRQMMGQYTSSPKPKLNFRNMSEEVKTIKKRTTTATTIPTKSVRETGQLQPESAKPQSWVGKAGYAALFAPVASASYVFDKGADVVSGKKSIPRTAREVLITDPMAGGASMARGEPEAIGSFIGGLGYSFAVPKIGDISAPPKPKPATVEFVATARKTQRGNVRQLVELEAKVGKKTRRSRIIGEVASDDIRSAGAGVMKSENTFIPKPSTIVSKAVEIEPRTLTTEIRGLKSYVEKSVVFEKARGLRTQMKGDVKGTVGLGGAVTKEVLPNVYSTRGQTLIKGYDINYRGVTSFFQSPADDVGLVGGRATGKAVKIDPATFLTPDSLTKALPKTSVKPPAILPTKTSSSKAKTTSPTPKADVSGIVSSKMISMPKMSSTRSERVMPTAMLREVQDLRPKTMLSYSFVQGRRSGLEQVARTTSKPKTNQIMEPMRMTDLTPDLRKGILPTQKQQLKQPPVERIKPLPRTVIRPPVNPSVPYTSWSVSVPDIGGFGRTGDGRKRGKRSYKYTPTVVGIYSGRTTRLASPRVGIGSVGIRYPAVGSGPSQPKSIVGNIWGNRKNVKAGLKRFGKDISFKLGRIFKL